MRRCLLCLAFLLAVCGCKDGSSSDPGEPACLDDLPCSLDQARQDLIAEYLATNPGASDTDARAYATTILAGGCFVTGIGHIGSDENGNGISDRPGAGRAHQDSYGGNAMGMKDGRVRGQWQNTTHLEHRRNKFHGQAEFLLCWNDGGPGPDVPRALPNRAAWGGSGTWDHEPGYLFIVSAADYKEGKEGGDANIRDAYAITVYRDVDGDRAATRADEVVYEESDCVYGNFQIHPPNQGHPYTTAAITNEMARIVSGQDLCPSNNW
ncbi:MAG: hypothetical protein HY698_14505 [Deltaproteobacteria bacterium]|nr:hypothetical protein [Deltaproteobacteria bacterium]